MDGPTDRPEYRDERTHRKRAMPRIERRKHTLKALVLANPYWLLGKTDSCSFVEDILQMGAYDLADIEEPPPGCNSHVPLLSLLCISPS